MPKVSFRVNRFLVVFILCFYSIGLFSANEYNIIPYPKQLIPQNGSFTINSRTIVLCSIHQPEVLKFARQFTAQFKLVSGIELSIREIENADTTNTILFQHTLNSENPEAYRLHISHRAIRIQANSPNGFFYGLQTLYQLLPAVIYGNKKAVGEKWSAPAVDIVDAPRFPYRGLHWMFVVTFSL